MRVGNELERKFYETEAAKEGWSKRHLQRQINTHLFARLVHDPEPDAMLQLASQGQEIESPADMIKTEYMLDFLGLQEHAAVHESTLETSIIQNLQAFLLELGKGFAFVGRQRRMQFDEEFFYIDLVFYNCILKCYLLIDIKTGKLSHQDVGQMDSYVRMFDDLVATESDLPTIGLILCAQKNETIARYSILHDKQQLFASKYMLYLPSVETLQKEVQKITNQQE